MICSPGGLVASPCTNNNSVAERPETSRFDIKGITFSKRSWLFGKSQAFTDGAGRVIPLPLSSIVNAVSTKPVAKKAAAA